jgi:hypothetical protein
VQRFRLLVLFLAPLGVGIGVGAELGERFGLLQVAPVLAVLLAGLVGTAKEASP